MTKDLSEHADLTISPRHRTHPLHLLLRSLPPLPSRTRSRLHHLRQQCSRIRTKSHLPFLTGQNHSYWSIRFLRGTQHHRFCGDFLHRTGDETSEFGGIGLCFWCADEEACEVHGYGVVAVVV